MGIMEGKTYPPGSLDSELILGMFSEEKQAR